jgi:glutamate formiminotransferase/formiminotetrahydrofolate cyclodeaminase
MSQQPLIECVPNFSDGRNPEVIRQITDVIEAIEGVKLLDVDPGKATNRTVVTFVGHPEVVIEAAFLAIQKASEVIDMRHHQGEHPRMGATDVCPLIPVSGITMEETAQYAHQLAKRVGTELKIPIFMYESAATSPERKNLATVRSGEYEGFAKKIKKPEWKPDYGPAELHVKAGVTAIGARDFLIAYNVNLNTTSVRRANSIAFDVREAGRVKREGNPVTGNIIRDANGEAVRIPGKCKSVKAIGWYIEEYGITQISMNLTDIKQTALHEAFEACRESATRRGMRVTGSEMVGLVPLQVMLDAGKYYLEKQQRSAGIPEREIIKIAIKSLGLDELSPFDPDQKIIEYLLADSASQRLIKLDLQSFADETASESVAPGGGSVAAYVGALGVSLGTMVANLSAHKRGWDDRWDHFSLWAEKGEKIKQKLMHLVDADTDAFNKIIEAFRLPKSTDEEKSIRSTYIQEATKGAIEVPMEVLRTTVQSFELLEAMANEGNPASKSDAAVGALCARAAAHGAYLNVKINLEGLKDEDYQAKIVSEADQLKDQADLLERKVVEIVAL